MTTRYVEIGWCDGNARFTHREDADAARNQRRQMEPAYPRAFHVFHCSACDGYHVRRDRSRLNTNVQREAYDAVYGSRVSA